MKTTHAAGIETYRTLQTGMTVVVLGREYRVVSPGSPGKNAMLESVVNPNIILFVDAAEFDVPECE